MKKRTDKEKTKQMLSGSADSHILHLPSLRRTLIFLVLLSSPKEAKVLKAELRRIKLLVFLQLNYIVL